MKYFLIILLFFSLSLKATTIHVGKRHTIKSVKKGIALAKNGDTLIVHSGLYKEGNIIIDKRIIFLGKGLPVLDGEVK
jgi:nitrous oxidase accessory protein